MLSKCSYFLIVGIFLSVSLQTTLSALSTKPGDRLCRFYSGMKKQCQSQCVNLTPAEIKVITSARGSPPTTISVKEISNTQIDPILFIKCTDKPVSSRWSSSQGFLAFPSPPASLAAAYKKANVYVGACVLHEDAAHSWECRGCEHALTDDSGKPVSSIPQSCFIGGEDQYKAFYKIGWRQSGSDAGTLNLFHPAN